MTEKEVRESLMEAYVIKSNVKQKVFENTKQTFVILKKVLKDLEHNYTNLIKDKVPPTLFPVFKDKGAFEAEFVIGGDLLVFSMHSNVFEFDDKHPVWNIPYIKEDTLRAYCVARIFINKDNHFFVEGKRQSDEVVKDFAIDTISPGILRQIIETAIEYSIEFDLLVALMRRAGRVVPRESLLAYAGRENVTVGERTVDVHVSKHSKMVTGKRLGFSFNSDDV